MKIKRYFAPDVRQAMRQIREELGDDAVILSNKRVNGGVEIIAAIDYDEQAIKQEVEAEQQHPAPQAASRSAVRATEAVIPQEAPKINSAKPQVVWSQEPTLMAMRNEIETVRGLLETKLANLSDKDHRQQHPFDYELRQRLAQLGIGVSLARSLIAGLPAEGNIEELWRRVLGKLAVNLPVTNDDILVNGGVVALVGSTGVGKTTTIAKLAARYTLRHGPRSVALISTDNYRIGAHEQLKAYARILDVPARLVGSAEELQEALDYFCDKQLVLIDTAGMGQRDMRLTQQLSMLKSDARLKTYLVASTTSRLSGLDDVARNFEQQGVVLNGCILTKIDESTCIGHALDVAIKHKLPVAYVSDGQRVPEDLQPARAHTLVSRSVALMQENVERINEELPGMGYEEVAS